MGISNIQIYYILINHISVICGNALVLRAMKVMGNSMIFLRLCFLSPGRKTVLFFMTNKHLECGIVYNIFLSDFYDGFHDIG